MADDGYVLEWLWSVVVIRLLNLANDDKALKEGGVYNVGFAVHEDAPRI